MFMGLDVSTGSELSQVIYRQHLSERPEPQPGDEWLGEEPDAEE